MPSTSLPQTLSLDVIAFRCKQETERFWNKLTYSPLFCFELFYRALSDPTSEESKQTWAFIHQQYHRQVTLWVRRHQSTPSVNLAAETLADLALEKMWVSFAGKPDKLNDFPLTDVDRCLKALLKFLQMCVHSVIMDAIETRNDDHLDDVDESTLDADPTIAEDFWDAIHRRLKDEKERLVIDASFVYGYKPRQVYEAYPDYFQNIKEIHRIKENVLARLKRDASLDLNWNS